MQEPATGLALNLAGTAKEAVTEQRDLPGADAIAQRTHTAGSLLRACFRGVTLARLAIDLPGLLLMAFAAFVVVLITLALVGVISID